MRVTTRSAKATVQMGDMDIVSLPLRALRSPFYYSHLSPPHARLSGRRQVERAGCMEKARMDREFCARIERAFKTGDENRQAAATTHGTISTRPR